MNTQPRRVKPHASRGANWARINHRAIDAISQEAQAARVTLLTMLSRDRAALDALAPCPST
jgi:hypothetical protein